MISMYSFMRKEESASDDKFYIVNFLSSTIDPWMQRKHSGDGRNKYDMSFNEKMHDHDRMQILHDSKWFTKSVLCVISHGPCAI